MAKREPFTWNPKDIIEVTNASGGNILLELNSGPLRLDSGRTLRLTVSALDQPAVRALLSDGNTPVRLYRRK